jgi:hypothetical protein
MVKGSRKSGKPWKPESKPFKALGEEWKKNLPSKSFEQKMKEKEEMLAARELERKMREESAEKRKKARKKTEAKRKRKEVNEMKSSQFQIIKDTEKVRSWTKSMRAKLTRMPAEMFYALSGRKD